MASTSVVNGVSNILLWAFMLYARHRVWNPYIEKTRSPKNVQTELLRKILKDNEATWYGKHYGFSEIRGYEDYCRRVPVKTYEGLRGYIEKQESTKEPYLTNNKPHRYALTSGTTGSPKYIPIDETTMKQHKQSQRIFTYAQYLQMPRMFSGKILAVAGSAVEGCLETGTPYGAMSGVLYREIPSVIRCKFVIPSEIFDIEDYELKYFLISAFALQEGNVTTIASVNPSTLHKISKTINSRFYEIVDLIKHGQLGGCSEGRHREIIKSICVNRDETRLIRLADLYQAQGFLLFKDLWPNLKAVVTWTGGSCGWMLPFLYKQISERTKIIEMGYFASEFRGNITVDIDRRDGVPTLHQNYFEFVERADWESDNKTYLRLDQIEQGKQYYIIATTQNGLYRYFINDVIEVTGRYNNTPLIRFVQKGKGTTNITGEKLYESQLIGALQKAAEACCIDPQFFVCLADRENQQYHLYIETKSNEGGRISGLIDEELARLNVEYRAKRKSGRLGPLTATLLREGTGELYKKFCLESGMKESQYKVMHLQYMDQCEFDFSKCGLGNHENKWTRYKEAQYSV